MQPRAIPIFPKRCPTCGRIMEELETEWKCKYCGKRVPKEVI